MLMQDAPDRDVPFFWSAHYGHMIRYVGHASEWDAIEIDGSIAARDLTAPYLQKWADDCRGRTRARS